MKPLYAHFYTHLGQHSRSIALKGFILRIVDTVVHALTQPQLAVLILIYTVCVVVAHGGCIALV